MVTPDTETALHVVLVHPEIGWNAGNAGRSCLAAGARLHLMSTRYHHLTICAIRPRADDDPNLLALTS